jgi:murein DD-endopeptidase MepM/ murein hydrolase activator NlpD
MNWRGRPLTSHEVVVNTIAATRTRTGLRVEAALDTRAYPLGVSVSAGHISALPIAPHIQRGRWNYTIHPADQNPLDAGGVCDRDQNRSQALRALADPRLTGMSREELDTLTTALATEQAARAEQRFFEQRGGPRRQAKGSHGRPLLTDAGKVLITVIYQRQICSQLVLSEMLELSPYPIGRAITETSKVLAERRQTVAPAVLRFTSAAALRAFLDTSTMPERPNRLATLGDPMLTGMSREDLLTLITRLSVRQAAEAERRKYRQRGGERRPAARTGIFYEKITDAERVLATILGLRKICSWDVVAELFQVSRRTIGNARTRVHPLLEQDGYTPVRATTRYPSATALLAAVTRPEEIPDTPQSPR